MTPEDRARDDREQAAFERWAERTSPSGDTDAVHRQWLDSWEFQEFLAEEADKLSRSLGL